MSPSGGGPGPSSAHRRSPPSGGTTLVGDFGDNPAADLPSLDSNMVHYAEYIPIRLQSLRWVPCAALQTALTSPRL